MNPKTNAKKPTPGAADINSSIEERFPQHSFDDVVDAGLARITAARSGGSRMTAVIDEPVSTQRVESPQNLTSTRAR